jgi:RND family efflux transporter MFP subunit
LLWERSNQKKGLATSTQDLALRYVMVTHPMSGEPDNEIVLPGNLVAYSEAPIFSRTNGYLKSWSTDIGAKVKEGQVLGVIEAPDVDAQLRQATATLAEARANQEIADLNFTRQHELLAKKVSSQQEFDQARTSMDAVKASVQAAEANVENLKVQQGFQMLIAPFDGVVTRRNTDIGALISASNGGQELFRVARTDILRVYVYVPQAYAAFVKEGLMAYLSFDEFPGKKFEGKVAHIAGSLDPSTRTLETEIQVNNRNGELFPGAFANVHLRLPLKQAPIVIPVNALIFRSEGSQVATVSDQGTIQLKNVSIGHDYGTSLEIIDGLTKEDRIVINPPDSLAQGDTVRVEEDSELGRTRRTGH